MKKLAALVLAALAAPALAQPTIVSDSGDTAWVLTSSALVLMMTIPGLALFYGGLVRAKNVLSVNYALLRDGGDRFAPLGGGGIQPCVR